MQTVSNKSYDINNESVICMYIYLIINEMITTITRSNTPAPTGPITASMFWPVLSDSNSTKSKLLYIEKKGTQ